MALIGLLLRRPYLFIRKALFPSAKDSDVPTTKPRLITFDELPKWYQDNHHIKTSYRPVSESYIACVYSLTYLHNETINIYTHLLPAVTLALALPTLQINISSIYAHAPWMDRFMLTLTPMAALATLSLSSTYHTLMNHSPFVSASCLLADFTGILVLILASFISGIYVGFYDSAFHQKIYFTMIISLVMISCLLVLHPRLQGPIYRPHRTAAFILTALSGFVPVFHGIWLYGWHDAYILYGVKWWLAEGFWYGVGAALFSTRWPESWVREARCDVWGSSHQLFHVCVVLGAGCHCWGVWGAWRSWVD